MAEYFFGVLSFFCFFQTLLLTVTVSSVCLLQPLELLHVKMASTVNWPQLVNIKSSITHSVLQLLRKAWHGCSCEFILKCKQSRGGNGCLSSLSKRVAGNGLCTTSTWLGQNGFSSISIHLKGISLKLWECYVFLLSCCFWLLAPRGHIRCCSYI